MCTTIIMTTRNNLVWLKECIKTLRWYTDLDKNKLKVFNACSTDGTEEFLYEEHVDTFTPMVNISAEKSTNMLIEQAIKDTKTKYVCMIHDDMLFTKDWLKTMLEEIKDLKDCYCLTPMMIMHKKAYMIPDERRNLIADKLREPFSREAISQLLLIKRECIEKIGYFDDAYEWGECSDDDYHMRIFKAEKKIFLTNRSIIYHCEKATRCNNPEHNEYVEKTRKLFFSKYAEVDFKKYDTKVLKFVDVDGEQWKVWGAR